MTVVSSAHFHAAPFQHAEEALVLRLLRDAHVVLPDFRVNVVSGHAAPDTCFDLVQSF